MAFDSYSQQAHDLVLSIRTQLTGKADELEGLQSLRAQLQSIGSNVTIDGVNDGLRKLAQKKVDAPETRDNPAAAIKAMDTKDLLQELAAVTLAKNWTDRSDGSAKLWER